MRKILLIIIICLSLVVAVSASAKSVGVFTKVSGTVDVRSPHEDESRQAKMGENISALDAIYTHDNARAEVTFHDGNIIRLASETRLKIREYTMRGSESSEVINLLKGKLRNIVKVVFQADFQNKKGKYEIHTPIAVCGVRGTDFFAYHEQGVSGAVFVTGKGYSYSSDVPGEVVTMTAGQQMTVRAGREAPKVTPARPKDIERFKKATLSQTKTDRKQKEIKKSQKVKESQKPADKTANQKQSPKNDDPGSRDDKGNSSSGNSSSDGGNSGNSNSGNSNSGNSNSGNSNSGNSNSGNSNSGNSNSGNSNSGNSNSGNSNSGNSNSGNSNSGNSNSGGGNSGGGNSGGGDSGGGDSGGGNSGGGNSGGGNSGGGNSGGSNSGNSNSGGSKK